METQAYLILDLYPLACALTVLPMSIILMYKMIIKDSVKYAGMYLLSFIYFFAFIYVWDTVGTKYRITTEDYFYYTYRPIEETIQLITSDIQWIADSCNVSYNYCIVVIYILLPIFILFLNASLTYLVYKHAK